MPIVLDHNNPFLLAHGGFQIQIEQTKAALDKLGVHVEFLRWWDDAQKAKLIHFFGRPTPGYIRAAQLKGIKVVISPLLTELGSRPAPRLFLQRWVTRGFRSFLPRVLTNPFGWDSFKLADATVALTTWEAHLMSYVFDAPAQQVHVVPNGVEEVFFDSAAVERNQWLICTATITERKRVLELAQAAVEANTPLWIIGKPYSESDPYGRRFSALAAQHPGVIRYEGPLQDRGALAKAYRAARGFVLLSQQESLSLSALEAAACECPLLLSDLPWARTVFRENASYCPITSVSNTAPLLKRFFDSAPTLEPPPKPLSWHDVGSQLKSLYERLLSTSL